MNRTQLRRACYLGMILWILGAVCGLAALAQTTKPTTKPTVPKPPTITPYSQAKSRPVRIFCESNPTPIDTENPEWTARNGQPKHVRMTAAVQYALALKLRPTTWVYNGTLNNTVYWPAGTLDWNLPNPQPNHCDPPTFDAVRHIARANVGPKDGLPAYRPLIFDIEETRHMNVDRHASKTSREKMLRHWIDAVRWAKTVDPNEWPVWIYWAGGAWPDAGNSDTFVLQRELLDLTGAACVCLYNWDLPAQSGGEGWFDEAARVDQHIKRFAPDVQRIAVVLPYWQVYFGGASAELNNTPLPIELWKRQIDWLVANGWDICVWLGYSKLADVKPHLEYVAKFR